MKIQYLKVCFEQTGSTKYIRTTESDCQIILESAGEMKMENFDAPYPTISGEWLQDSTKGEFDEKTRIFHQNKKLTIH